jgi:hypothetical protein
LSYLPNPDSLAVITTVFRVSGTLLQLLNLRVEFEFQSPCSEAGHQPGNIQTFNMLCSLTPHLHLIG